MLSVEPQPEQAEAGVLSAAALREPHAEDASEAEPLPAVSGEPAVDSPVPPVQDGMARVLPSIPPGPAGDVFAEVAQGLVSKRPNFTQQAMNTVFLDTASGVLVARAGAVQLDLGDQSPGAILDAVTVTVPEVQRILVTG